MEHSDRVLASSRLKIEMSRPTAWRKIGAYRACLADHDLATCRAAGMAKAEARHTPRWATAIFGEDSPTCGECRAKSRAYCRQMKKIEAVVPPTSLGTIRAELVRRGVCGNLTVTEVRHGETHGHPHPSTEHSDESLKEKIKIELIVSDRQIDKAVNIILRHAISDGPGRDGQITLLHVDEILQITQPIQGPTPV